MDLKKLLSIVTEADLTPQQQAQNVLQPGMNTAAPTNPWTNDPVKAAAWEKLSPQMKAKIGGADPTDKIIISAMADGSGWGRAKGINDANPDGTPKVKAPVTTATPSTVDQSGKPATAADPEKEKKVARFKELLTKAGVLTAPATPGNTDISKGAVDYNLAPATSTGPGIKLPAVKESVAFKSSIGKMLLESFDIGLEEATAQLSPEEYKELSKLYGDLSVTYKDDKALAPLFTAYNSVKPSWSSDAQATTPTTTTPTTTTPTTTTPTKKLAPVDPGTQELQTWLKNKGLDIGKFGADGRWGPATQKAVDAWKAKGLKPGNPEYDEFAALVNKTKDTDYTRQWYQKANPTAAAPTAAAPVAQSGKPAAPKVPADYDAQIKTISDKLTQLYKVNPNSPETKAAQAELQAVVAAKAKMMQGSPAVAQSGKSADGAWAVTNTPEYKQLLATMNTAFQKGGAESPEYKTAAAALTALVDKNKPVNETTSFANDEVQRIVSLVHYR